MLAIPVDGWYTSSRSSGASNCVEVAHRHGYTAVRDSRDKTGPVLFSTDGGWRAFIGGITAGSTHSPTA
ncbi:MAG: DUF397 domain-containing protein [Pseudonocardiaceae bacterium]